MNWFPDMVWLFLEWWVWPVLGVLLGLAIGWLVWRRGWRRSEHEMTGQFRSLRRNRDDLDVEVQSLQGRLTESQQRATEVEGQFRSLRADASAQSERAAIAAAAAQRARETEASSLQVQLADLRTQLGGARAERDEAMAKLAAQETEMQSVIDLRTELQRGLSDRDDEVVNLRAERLTSVEGLRSTSAELEGLREESVVLENDAQQARDRVVELESGLAERERALSEAEGVVVDLRDRASAGEARVGELEGELSAREARLGELEAQLSAVESLVGERDGRVAELEGEVSARDARVVELQGLVGERDARTAELESLLGERDGRVAELEGVLAEREGGLVELQALVGAGEARVGELESVLGERDGRVAELEGEVSARDGRVAELEGEVGERERALSEAEGVMVDLRDRASAGEARVAELEGVLAEREGGLVELQGLVGAGEARAAELESGLSERDGRVAELEGELLAREARLSELEGQMSAREDRVGELTDQLSDRDRQIQSLERTLEEHDAQLRELEETVLSSVAVPGSEIDRATDLAPDSLDGQLSSMAEERDLGYNEDLQQIKGIGPAMATMLEEQGITTYFQLATLDHAGVEALERRIDSFPGRIIRDDWVSQAAALHQSVHGEDLEPRTTIGRSEDRRALKERGYADYFEASLAQSMSERPSPDADDLKPIVGIGKKMQSMLNANGLTTFYQLARLDGPAIDDLETRSGIQPGRVQRENWVPQAAQLHFELHGEEIYDLVTVEGRYADAFEAQLVEAAKGRRLDYVDDLQMISGVGPKMDSLLQSNGLTNFLQVSLLDEAGVAALNARLDFFPGRIERDGWVDQARRLHNEHHPGA